MLFARSFSESVGDGVEEGEKTEYDGGGEGGFESDCDDELFDRVQSYSYCGALVAGIPPIIFIVLCGVGVAMSLVLTTGELEVGVDDDVEDVLDGAA